MQTRCQPCAVYTATYHQVNSPVFSHWLQRAAAGQAIGGDVFGAVKTEAESTLR